jgi:TrmH family RNA methyltransferase
VESPSNPYVRHCVKLREKARYRRDVGRLLVVGNEPVQEVLAALGGHERVHVLFRRSGVPADAFDLPTWAVEGGDGPGHGARGRGSVLEVSDAAMRKIAGLEEDAGCHLAAEVYAPAQADFAALAPGALPRLLALDGVQDPGNLGTLMRSAAGLGWGGVFLLPGCCDPFNDKALRASRGVALSLPIQKGDMVRLAHVCNVHGLQSLAASASGRDAGEVRRERPSAGPPVGGGGGVCLVLGSEGQGVTDEVSSFCEEVAIPMAGGVDSLNVGTAGGILMHLFRE